MATARAIAATAGGAAAGSRAPDQAPDQEWPADVPGRIEQELALFRERLRSPEAAEAFRRSWKSASRISARFS